MRAFKRVLRGRGLSLVTAATASALLLAACGGGSDSGTGSSSAAPGDVSSFIRLNGPSPQTAIFPGMVRDEGGANILGNILVGLTAYDPDGKLIMAAAESVTSSDNKVWTIKLRRDWTFTDGEKITARNYVDAWNYIADSRNGQVNTQTIRLIEGYTPKLEGPLSGLKQVDDYTVQVTLKTPLYDFPDRLSDNSMYPLPESAFKDMDAYGKHPVGNGPYMLDKWTRGISYSLKKNPDYKGPFKPKNNGLVYTVYATTTAAYADYLAGNIDVMQAPNDKLGNVRADSDGRMIIKPTNQFAYFGIPNTIPGFGYDRAGILRRQAVSMAINREEIIKTLFHGYYFPAAGFLPAAVFPKLQNVEGSDNAKFDVEKAKKLWAEAQAIEPLPANTKIEFHYNADGGHGPWVTAVSNMIKNNLGLDVSPAPTAIFRDFLGLAKTAKGFIRGTWNGGMTPSGTFDYMFLPTGNSNYGKFDNAKFNELDKQVLAETDANKRTEIFRQMVSILMQDLPVVPLWYYGGVTVYSSKVKNVTVSSVGSAVINYVEKS